MSPIPIITLSDGNKVPQLGFGTWQSKPGEVGQSVEVAIEKGYRHLDFAKVYQNQKEIAPALKKSDVPRSELFLTSKLWNSAHAPQHVASALDNTLAELEVDYLDLYLIHWPVAFLSDKPNTDLFPQKDGKSILDPNTTIVDTWKELIKLQKAGKVKSIGVSNFTAAAIDALEKATGVLPAPELLAYHKEKNITITAYSPLGNAYEGKKPVVQYDVIVEIAKKHDATPAQVLISWGALGGHTIIPKSVTPDRIASNFKSLDVKLDAVLLLPFSECMDTSASGAGTTQRYL